MGGVDTVVIIFAIVYFVVVIGVGVYSRKFTKKAADYYVAGRQVGAFVNGAALASTYLSPASFLGLPAFIFILGYPMWWALIGIIAGMTIAGILTAAPLRKYGKISFTDYYADRYEMPKLGRFIAGIPTLIAGFLYVILSLVGTAIFFVALLKLDYTISIILAVLVVLLYTVLGGMYATTWNAMLQAIIMAIASLIAGFALVGKAGGFTEFFNSILQNSPKIFNPPSAPTHPHILVASWLGVIGFFFTWHYGFATMPYTVVRFFTSMDEKTAKKSIIWSVLIGGLMYVGLIIIGTGAKYIIETFHPLAEKAAPIAAQKGKPTAIIVLALIQKAFGIGKVTDYAMIAAVEALKSSVIMGILVAGGLSIAMSTVAGWTMVLNALISKDWLGEVFDVKFVKEKPVLAARIVTVVVLVVSGLIALNPPALILDLSGWAFVVVIAALGPSLILGIWWKKATKQAAIWTSIVMTIMTLFSWLYAKLVYKSPHFFFLDKSIVTPHQFYWIFVGFIFFIIVSLLTQPPKEETVKKFCEDLHEE